MNTPDNQRSRFLLLLTLAALPDLSGCMSGTNLNTAKTMDWSDRGRYNN